jgi:hypothetical protein
VRDVTNASMLKIIQRYTASHDSGIILPSPDMDCAEPQASPTGGGGEDAIGSPTPGSEQGSPRKRHARTNNQLDSELGELDHDGVEVIGVCSPPDLMRVEYLVPTPKCTSTQSATQATTPILPPNNASTTMSLLKEIKLLRANSDKARTRVPNKVRIFKGRLKAKDREIEILDERIITLEHQMYVKQLQYNHLYEQATAKVKRQDKLLNDTKEQHHCEIE